MPGVAEVLSRAPVHKVNTLIPDSVDTILEVLNDESLSSRRRVEIALEVTPPEQVLRTTKHRNLLIDVLEAEEAEALAAKAEKTGTDNVYTRLKNGRFYKNSQSEAALFEFFNEDVPEVEDEDNPGVTDVPAKYGLFDYQLRIFERVMDTYEDGENRVFLHMPTGSGKTRISMSLVCRMIRESDSGTVIWLAEGQELLEQAVDEFKTAWAHLGNQEVQVSRFYGDHSWTDIDDGLIVAGLYKLWNKEKRSAAFLWNLSQDVSLIVFDEAHRSVADTYQRMITRLTGFESDYRLLGLSATPGRTFADRTADRELSEFYHRNKVAIEVPNYDDPFDYLISEGYLSDPSFETLHTESPILDQELSDEVAGMSRGGEYSKAVLDQLTEDERRNLKITRQILELIEDGHMRIILFATTVKHAQIISAVLEGQGVSSAVITAETPEYKRERDIKQFKSNSDEPRVLCNYNVLTTGFDAPKTSAAVIARPTTSLVLYSQMVGRAIRGPEVGGTEEAEIWTVIDTDLPGFGDLPEAFWNWEDVW